MGPALKVEVPGLRRPHVEDWELLLSLTPSGNLRPGLQLRAMAWVTLVPYDVAEMLSAPCHSPREGGVAATRLSGNSGAA